MITRNNKRFWMNIRKIFDFKIKFFILLTQNYRELFLSKSTLRKYFIKRKVFVDVINQIECAHSISTLFEF